MIPSADLDHCLYITVYWRFLLSMAHSMLWNNHNHIRICFHNQGTLYKDHLASSLIQGTFFIRVSNSSFPGLLLFYSLYNHEESRAFWVRLFLRRRFLAYNIHLILEANLELLPSSFLFLFGPCLPKMQKGVALNLSSVWCPHLPPWIIAG